ncbi:hypothetical protein G195_000238 [Phytophthora kernoviae 00238/432]|uniref:Uncharacterized protein n=1 Tax=Phytophthora kernoviae 00238/432 TaxID=1284355 RepID=A0A8J4SI30_9STRA|nr:hypothetical protein G195_000238 [Phytophthora kernoviae 00238/432]
MTNSGKPLSTTTATSTVNSITESRQQASFAGLPASRKHRNMRMSLYLITLKKHWNDISVHANDANQQVSESPIRSGFPL